MSLRTSSSSIGSRGLRVLAGSACALLVAGCGVSESSDADRLRVIASTEIIADWVHRVGGDRVEVDTIIPIGGDPHSYEPSPSDASKIRDADLAFTNGLLLEDHSVIRLFDANTTEGVPNIAIAEHAEGYGATLIPLVEDVGLDVVWLGFGVRGEAPSRSSEIRFELTEADGPGDITMFLTDALGQPHVHWNSADGLGEDDQITLPPNAHTHVNWTFSEPGVYRLRMAADLTDELEGVSEPVAETTFVFTVGVDPEKVGDDATTATVIDDGHVDLTLDLDDRSWLARDDERGDLDPPDVLINVPDRAIEPIPSEDIFAFLGEGGHDIHVLPQAVLGKHVHGEIDPHLWQDVSNAGAYVRVITDTLIELDPDGRDEYEASRDTYLAQLDELHADVADTIGGIPKDRRQLITTHDAFGYLAAAYGMEVAGFVVPNPAAEPSARQVRELSTTIADLEVAAVFVEPNLHARADVLRQVADDLEVRVCTLHGDALPPDQPDYLEMLRQNADELHRCLGEDRSS